MKKVGLQTLATFQELLQAKVTAPPYHDCFELLRRLEFTSQD